MRTTSTVLSNLIVLAEEAIVRPQLLDDRFRQRFVSVADDMRHVDARPAEDLRTTRAGMLMVGAIEEYLSPALPADRRNWLMVAGVLLPLLRNEAFAALKNERGQRAS